MTFWFCLGTAAELIKVYPLIIEAQKREIRWYVLSTGQSGINLRTQYLDFKLPTSAFLELTESKRDLTTTAMAFYWFAKSIFISSKRLKQKITSLSSTSIGRDDFWFVHGDTLSTLLGSIYGRKLNLKTVHIEAGMRSHNILNPFPEEICRKIVSQICSYHMAPDLFAKNNLTNEGINQNVYVTEGNTVIDSLDLVINQSHGEDIPTKPYALVNVHRFENLNSKHNWNLILNTIIETSRQLPVVFVLMPNTEAKIESDPELKNILLSNNIKLVKRIPFSKFVHLLNQSEFVLTDGGTNQEECFHIGKPCLILRTHTERTEGIGKCCVLSGLDVGVINNFLVDPNKFKNENFKKTLRPTDIVFESLLTPKSLAP